LGKSEGKADWWSLFTSLAKEYWKLQEPLVAFMALTRQIL
jgi:hypothetical protein